MTEFQIQLVNLKTQLEHAKAVLTEREFSSLCDILMRQLQQELGEREEVA